MDDKIIGRIIATEKKPTSVDNFAFWTDSNTILNPFDIIKVKHINNSVSYGVIEDISHITDAASFLTDYISSDFGDVGIDAPTLRIGMNYVEAKIIRNDKKIYIPVQSNSEVALANKDEIIYALGLRDIRNPLPCGYLEMYENTGHKEILPVNFNSKFVIGPEGAHLNISGISGLAAKTSYAMFLMKAIQDSYLKLNKDDEDSTAFVMFNVKGKDLLAIHQPNDFLDEESHEATETAKKETFELYKSMGLSTEPFKYVQYYFPHSDNGDVSYNTFFPEEDLKDYIKDEIAKQYVFNYEQDKENLDLFFSNIDDSTQTIDAIQEYIISGQGDFNKIDNWSGFLSELDKLGQSNSKDSKKEIPVVSWRKFRRIISKTIKHGVFTTGSRPDKGIVRLEDELVKIKKNEVHVIDIAKLSEVMQAFVFGNVVRIINKIQLGDYADVNPPKRIVIFIDELNKYASTETPKNSPILRQILDVAERGRSLGIILFAAEQFRSAIHDRVKGNCSTHAYGRTNAIETGKADYKVIPETYKNILTRLEQGEYLLQNPIFSSMLKIKFPKPIYKQFKQ